MLLNGIEPLILHPSDGPRVRCTEVRKREHGLELFQGGRQGPRHVMARDRGRVGPELGQTYQIQLAQSCRPHVVSSWETGVMRLEMSSTHRGRCREVPTRSRTRQRQASSKCQGATCLGALSLRERALFVFSRRSSNNACIHPLEGETASSPRSDELDRSTI